MSKSQAPSGEVFIQYAPLPLLLRWPRNPKKHDLPTIKALIRKHGFINPIIIDETSNRMTAGHGRLDSLLEMKTDGDPPPKRIRVGEDGEWWVPVLRGVSFDSEKDAEEYLMGDNRATELGGWDYPLLVPMLQEYRINNAEPPIGWTQDEMFNIIDKYGPQIDSTDSNEDLVPEVPKRPVAKLGQIWQLGFHRLLCGDATKLDDVRMLTGDARAKLMNTDPPYGDSWVQKAKDMAKKGLGHTGARAHAHIEGDQLDDKKLRVLLKGFMLNAKSAHGSPLATYVWCGSKRTLLDQVMKECGWHVHQAVTWLKPGMVIGRLHYHPRTEQAVYGWLQGAGKVPWYGPRNQTDIWEIGRENDKIHPTQKPVALFETPLRNHTKVGEIAYEPFAGSGSQFIAAEKLERRCFGIELSPGYCDVIIERWQNFANKKAQLITGPKLRVRKAG